MIEAVLFDFDGTLIDTNDLIRKSYNYASNKVFKRDITDEEFFSLYGKPLIDSVKEKYGDAGDKFLEYYFEFNEKNHDIIAKEFDGAYEGLVKLKENGFKLAIVTSKKYKSLMWGINLLNYGDIFDVLITPEDTKLHKPNPEPILIGCEKLGVNPENSIYVGDSVFDLKAGKAAKTKIAAVSYSLTDKSELLSFNPDYYINSVKQLADILID